MKLDRENCVVLQGSCGSEQEFVQRFLEEMIFLETSVFQRGNWHEHPKDLLECLENKKKLPLFF